MENNKSTFFSPQFILGVMIIAVGVVFMLDNFDIIYAGTILRYWPAILVVYGASKAMQTNSNSGQLFGWVIAGVGALMLLDRLDFISFRVWDWWPVILILIGLNFLRGSWNRRGAPQSGPLPDSSADTDSFIKNMAMLGGIKRVITTKDFRGGEISALMGGCELDLRDAEMKVSEARVDVNIIMGGLEMRVPMGWSVIVEATPILGGVDDKTYPAKDGSTKKIIITGSVIMGGIEVKN